MTTNHYDVDNLVPGFTYKIIVTPRSNVVNALPGLPFELEGTTNVEKKWI